MKLRIRGESLRFRLGQSEVRRLAEEGAIEESTQFDVLGNNRFVYALESATGTSRVSAVFDSGKMIVRIPADLVHRWASSSQVRIEKFQDIGAAGQLKILIEKDFECIDAPPDEPQDDAFPHPGKGLECGPGDNPRQGGTS